MITEKLFIEIGRVALIKNDEKENKVCVIVDIVDQTKMVIDGPCTGVSRRTIHSKNLFLLDFVLSIERGADSDKVKKIFSKEKVLEKLKKLDSYKLVLAEEKRKSLTDFERFQVSIALKRRKELLEKLNV